MINSRKIHVCLGVFLLLAISFVPIKALGGTLQVGAARVDITPAPDAALPMSGYGGRTQGFQRIHDHIYVRAIVLSDGSRRAAILAWELIGMPTPVWADLSQRIAKETGIPVDNLMLAGVHDHGAPSLAGMYDEDKNPVPGTVAYTAQVENNAVEAVRRAISNLQPAKVGFGTGKAYVNINRCEYFPKEGWWWIGYNPDGPSDKTVAVIKFTDLAGKPLALLINYAVHGVVMGFENLAITGDLPGATSRYVEQYYQGKVETRTNAGGDLEPAPQEKTDDDNPVAIWTSGAAGDQNPLVIDPHEDFTMVEGLGRILAQEVLRVANRKITVMSTKARISSAQQVITCPGRTVDPGERPRTAYTFHDSPPVPIRLSMVRVNDLVLAGVSGEVFNSIYQRLRDQSPVNIMMVTHANGSSGYIPSDDAFDDVGYEVTSSSLKRGCAEPGIINGFLEMMQAK